MIGIGLDGGTTDAMTAVGRSQLPAWRGEAHATGRGISVDVLGSGRGMGSPTMHANVKLTSDAGAHIVILISQSE